MNDEKPRIGKKGAAKKVTAMLKEIRKQPLSKKVFDIVDHHHEETKNQHPQKKIATPSSDLET